MKHELEFFKIYACFSSYQHDFITAITTVLVHAQESYRRGIDERQATIDAVLFRFARDRLIFFRYRSSNYYVFSKPSHDAVYRRWWISGWLIERNHYHNQLVEIRSVVCRLIRYVFVCTERSTKWKPLYETAWECVGTLLANAWFSLRRRASVCPTEHLYSRNVPDMCMLYRPIGPFIDSFTSGSSCMVGRSVGPSPFVHACVYPTATDAVITSAVATIVLMPGAVTLPRLGPTRQLLWRMNPRTHSLVRRWRGWWWRRRWRSQLRRCTTEKPQQQQKPVSKSDSKCHSRPLFTIKRHTGTGSNTSSIR